MSRRSLTIRLANELRLLQAAWVIAADDDRRRKPLWIGPSTVRRWSALQSEAISSLSTHQRQPQLRRQRPSVKRGEV